MGSQLLNHKQVESAAIAVYDIIQVETPLNMVLYY